MFTFNVIGMWLNLCSRLCTVLSRSTITDFQPSLWFLPSPTVSGATVTSFLSVSTEVIPTFSSVTVPCLSEIYLAVNFKSQGVMFQVLLAAYLLVLLSISLCACKILSCLIFKINCLLSFGQPTSHILLSVIYFGRPNKNKSTSYKKKKNTWG